MGPGILLAGLAGLIALIYAATKDGGGTIVEVNGRKWKLELIGESDTQKAFLVKAPERSFGPHMEMPVLQFSQLKANPYTRKLEAKFPDVPAGIFDLAVTDFGLPVTF